MSKNLPKGDLVKFLADESQMPSSMVQSVLDALGPVIRTNAANGYTITVPGLGRFAEKVRSARPARNPNTGLPVDVPASTTLAFKPSKPSTKS